MRIQERDNSTIEKIEARDRYELGLEPYSPFNVGAVIAKADKYIDTSGTIDDIFNKVKGIYGEINNEEY